MWIDGGPKMKSIRNSKIKWNNGKVKGKLDQRGSSRSGPVRGQEMKRKRKGNRCTLSMLGIDVDRSCIDVASDVDRCRIDAGIDNRVHRCLASIVACDVASVWHRCGIDVEWMWIDATSMWHRCGINVASMWIDVASMQIDTGSMWHRFGIDIGINAASMWDRCGIDVASMWRRCGSMWHRCRSIWDRCGIDLASMWHQCGIDVGSMWH